MAIKDNSKGVIPPIINGWTIKSIGEPYAIGGMGILHHYINNDLFAKEIEIGGTASSSALVKMPKKVPLNPLQKELFENEINLAIALSSNPKYFPKVLGYNEGKIQEGDEIPTPYLMMSLEHGVNLRHILSNLEKENKYRRKQDKIQIPLPILSYIMSEYCNAIEKIHEKKRLYNDGKPANTLIRYDGSLSLIDFGISTKIGESLPPIGLGTTDYNSPEHAVFPPLNIYPYEKGTTIPKATPAKLKEKLEKMKKIKNLNEKSDVYIIGMIAYELATLRNEAAELPEALRLTKEDEINDAIFELKVIGKKLDYELIQPLRKHRKEWSTNKLERIIRAALNPDCEKRPALGEVKETFNELKGRYIQDSDVIGFFGSYMHNMPV